MNQLERIIKMEQILDETAAAVETLNRALDRYAVVREDFAELTAYYEDGRWMEDFEADAAGRLPRDLKRGVLSEDAVYDLLAASERLRARLRNWKD